MLSANQDTPVIVENVMEDVDLKTEMSRQEFEELAESIWIRIQDLVNSLIDRSGLDKVRSTTIA